MLLQREQHPALNTIVSYGPGYVDINAVAYRHPICFAPEGDVTAWSVQDIADITPAHLRQLGRLQAAPADPLAFLDGRPTTARSDDSPELVLIGTGSRQQLLPAALTATLTRHGIGIEVMSTAAAARTYNILMAEGRRIIVALLVPEETA